MEDLQSLLLSSFSIRPKAIGDLLLARLDMLALLVLVGVIRNNIGLVKWILRRLLELLVKHIMHLVLSQSWVF